jgi:ERCC4-type nuclease
MDILADMEIIVDSREQKWHHIKDYLDEQNIPYIVKKLEVGDYSFQLPNYPEVNMDNKIIVERKNSLSEIASNFTSGRERFTKEFERVQEGQKVHLVVETATWKKLFNGTYRSKFHPNSFKASLITWCIRYKLPVWFAEVKESPEIIYKLMYYELNEHLNNLK